MYIRTQNRVNKQIWTLDTTCASAQSLPVFAHRFSGILRAVPCLVTMGISLGTNGDSMGTWCNPTIWLWVWIQPCSRIVMTFTFLWVWICTEIPADGMDPLASPRPYSTPLSISTSKNRPLVESEFTSCPTANRSLDVDRFFWTVLRWFWENPKHCIILLGVGTWIAKQVWCSTIDWERNLGSNAIRPRPLKDMSRWESSQIGWKIKDFF